MYEGSQRKRMGCEQKGEQANMYGKKKMELVRKFQISEKMGKDQRVWV